MSVAAESAVGYHLSSQQCAAHVESWQESAPVHAVLIEGPSGSVQTEMLRAVLDRMIEHHEILRTCYHAVAGLRYPIQQVRPAAGSTWKVLAPTDDDGSLLRAARSLVNPQNGPIVAAALAAVPSGRLRWALAASAYSVDARALQELAAACVNASTAGNPKAISPDDFIQYPDYAAWQSELRASELGQEGARYWESQAASAGESLRLPFETGSTVRDRQVECLELTDAAETTITELCDRLNLSADLAIGALWCGFMARVLQTDRLSIDWHNDARTEELHDALGNFTLRLPLSLDFSSERSVADLVRSVTKRLETAVSWQDCFDAAAHADRWIALGTVRHRLEFAYTPVLPLSDGWTCRRIELDPVDARLQCLCFVDGGRHVLRWQGTASHLSGTLQTWARQFVTLLELVGRDSEQLWARLPLLGHDERERILHACRHNSSQNGLAQQQFHTLHSLFEARVQRAPESIAVVCGETRLTYRDLNRKADALARRLRSHGIALEQPVGIHFGRSADVITAMLAVLKSGAVYVPLDPAYPRQRIDDMITDAGISTIIGAAKDRTRFEGVALRYVSVDEPEENTDDVSPAAEIEPSHLAYVIYTSGSTGKPKGVMISHANAVASTLARFSFYELPLARFLLLSSPSFDSSVAGIYWTLGQGGTLYIPSEGMHQDPGYIAKLISREKISTLLCLPSLYKHVLDSLDGNVELKCAIVAGEACHADVVELHTRKLPAAVLVNEYGPTEGTVWSNAFQIAPSLTADRRIPIGRPIGSMYGYVLDDQLEICPMGLPGEWYIGGDGIARGYVGRPALTAERFVADSLGVGQRLYRTGDRVRMRPDGEIEYLGRNDNQVKVRGYRIELEEIEVQLLAQPEVWEAAVVIANDGSRGDRIIGYVSAARTSTIDVPVLRNRLSKVLPDYMVPSAIVVLGELPLNANGKVHKSALPEPELGNHRNYEAPQGEIEEVLAKIWGKVLGIERVGRHDNFFEIGGHSLAAVQVASASDKCFGEGALSVAEVIQDPVLRIQASRIASPDPCDVHVARRSSNVKGTSLFCFPGLHMNVSDLTEIVATVGDRRSVYTFGCYSLSRGRWKMWDFETLASLYVEHILRLSVDEPVALLGWSSGGDLAFEAARQLNERRDVRFVGLLDVCVPTGVSMGTAGRKYDAAAFDAAVNSWLELSNMRAQWAKLLSHVSAEEKMLLLDHLRDNDRPLPLDGPAVDSAEFRLWLAVSHAAMMRRYRWRPSDIPVHVWNADATLASRTSQVRDWQAIAQLKHCTVIENSDHATLPKHGDFLAELKECIQRSDRKADACVSLT